MKSYILRIIYHKELLLWTVLFSFCLFLLNSYHNFNYYFPDEHFQIVEFAAFKQNLVPASSLAWEYSAQERQALQPFIVYCIFEMLGHLAVTSHVDQMIILKILNSVFTLFCIYRFVIATLSYFKDRYKPFYILTSFLIWFVPSFFVRFTSETFAQSLLLLACSFLFVERQKTHFLVVAGFLLGLAFFARFQSAFPIMGLFAGLFFSNGYRFKAYSKIAVGGLISAGLCIVIDHWFYDEWVFTPWQYFSYQILQGVAADFGTLPFYQYLIYLFTFSTPVYGLVFLVSLLVPFVLKRKPDPIYLAVFTTIVLLSFVGHKEFRFLWAILLFFPFILVVGIQSISDVSSIASRIFHNSYFVALLVLINSGFILKGILVNNDILVSKGNTLAYVIARDYSAREVILFYPDENWHPFKIPAYTLNEPTPVGQDAWLWRRFLMPENYEDQFVADLEAPQLFNRKVGRANLLYVNKALFLSSSAHVQIMEKGYRRVGVSIPDFADELICRIPKLGQLLDHRITYLFELK